MFLGDDTEDLSSPDNTIAATNHRHLRPIFPHPSNPPEHNFLGIDNGKIAARHIGKTHAGVGSFKTVMERRIYSHYADNLFVPCDNHMTHSAIVLWDPHKRVQTHFAGQ